MGKVVSLLRLWASGIVGDHPPGVSVADWSKEQWREAMLLNINRINQKRKRKIPDQPRYETKLAESSVRTWHKFIDPAFVSNAGLTKSNIVQKHAKAISKGFHKWEKSLDDAYATVDGVEGKRFREKVEAAVERYAENSRVGTGLNGDKIRGYGCNVIATMWLANDPRVIKWMQGAEKIDGGPVDIIRPGLLVPFKGGMVPLLTQGGALIVKADYFKDVFAEMNGRNNDFLSGVQDNALYEKFTTGGPSHCDWVLDESGGLILEVQISKK